MGWLFAVALGLQREGSARRLWRALPPLAAGMRWRSPRRSVSRRPWVRCPADGIRWVVAAMLLGLGVGAARPATASAAVGCASVRGTSALVVPHGVGARSGAHGAAARTRRHLTRSRIWLTSETTAAWSWPAGGGTLPEWSAMLLHSTGYLAVTMLAAVVVYEKLGVSVLRKAWVNLDLVWAVALIGTGALTAVL